MKAAVLTQFGHPPRYQQSESPIPVNDNDLLLKVKAVALKNLDKIRATGTHYASHKKLPCVVGMDGVGELEDGRLVYAQVVEGMMAEEAIVRAAHLIPVPAGLATDLAAALPNAVLGAAMALQFRGKMKKGQVVFINGATGVTGQLAVQIAKHYGASTVIATGRNKESLKKLVVLGADEIITLNGNWNEIKDQIRSIHNRYKIDLVIDYLWGKPVEVLLRAIKGGGMASFAHTVRIVTVGEMAGSHIQLASGLLRSSAIEIVGSGFGSLSEEELTLFRQKIMPEMYDLAVEGKLKMDTVVHPLSSVEKLWNSTPDSGTRLVFKI